MTLFDVARDDGIERAAIISPDGLFRYDLLRRWQAGGQVAFVGLNPSTADGIADDPTIRRCIGFARSWGFGALRMVNLFAYRATDPQVLAFAATWGVDVVGPHNDAVLRGLRDSCGLIVAAWGAHAMAAERAKVIGPLLGDYAVLGLTRDGHPRHPLYMKASCWPRHPRTLDLLPVSTTGQPGVPAATAVPEAGAGAEQAPGPASPSSGGAAC